MNIVISAQGQEFESQIDPRFGRCQYFVFVDPDDMTVEAVPNPNLQQGSGVGIRSAQLVCDKGAKAVLTGNVGPKAQQVLSTAGIEVVTGVTGTVRQAVEDYKAGRLGSSAGRPETSGSDIKSWQNTGISGGTTDMKNKPGRGMGRCKGNRPAYGTPTGAGGQKEEAISSLKSEAEGLRGQLQQLEQRISELEKS